MKLKILLFCMLAIGGFGASYALAGNGHGKAPARTDDRVVLLVVDDTHGAEEDTRLLTGRIPRSTRGC